MPVAPDILNYYIGKGISTFDGDDLGNAPEVEFTPSIETLEHFSSRQGVRTRDRVVVLEKSATLRTVLDEWTPENLGLMLLGDVTGNSIEIFSRNSIEGEFIFDGTNQVGQQILMTLLSVSFVPGAGLNLISDEFGTMELTGEVSSVAGSFGTAVLTDAVTT